MYLWNVNRLVDDIRLNKVSETHLKTTILPVQY